MLADSTNIESELELKYLSSVLKQAVFSMPEKQRQVIQRTILQEERLTELAAKMGITVQAVHNLKKRALSRLKVLCTRMYISERG